MSIITAKQNQSFLDLVIMQYGTLEAAMLAAKANNVPLSLLPANGSSFEMPATTGSKSSTSYLTQNGIVVGTRGRSEAIDMTIVLKPEITLVPTESAPPHTVGYYAFNLSATSGFINEFPLLDHYLTTNMLHYQAEEIYVVDLSYHTAVEYITTPMAARSIPYHLPITEGFGYMLVWNPPSAGIPTVTFRDVEGNTAVASPFIILDNVSQNYIVYFIADINIEVVSRTAADVTMRLTRTHPVTIIPDFSDFDMLWTEAAADGTPDPDDPGNDNVCMLTLPAGTYTLGVKTIYNNLYDISFPTSDFTMVIKIQ